MEIAAPPQSFYTEEFPARRISGEVVERPREEVPHGVPISLRTVQRSFVSRGRFEPSWSKRLVMAKWVLSGQAAMGIKGDRVSFGPGEVAIYTPSIAHQFWAMGEINEMCWFTMDGPLAEEFVSELQLRPGVYGNVLAPVQQLTELMESLKDRTIQGRRHASLRAIELWYQLANSIRSPEIPSVVTRAQHFIREHFANPAQSHVSKRVVPIVNRNDLAILSSRAFGNYDYRIAWTLTETTTQIRFPQTISQQMKHALITKRMFGDQNQVRLSCQSRPQRQMPGVPSHHLDDLHPTMRSRGRA